MEDEEGPMIPSRASTYYYVGRALPQGSDVPLRDLDHNDFTPAQTKDLNLSGLRHWRGHKDKWEIGSIMEDPTYDGEKYVIGKIDVNDPIGKLTVMEILDGKTSDLSLTHDYGLLTYPGLYVEMKEPTEISSVGKGNRPDCRILWGAFDTDLEEQSIRNDSMAEQMDTTPPSTQPPVTTPSSVPAAQPPVGTPSVPATQPPVGTPATQPPVGTPATQPPGGVPATQPPGGVPATQPPGGVPATQPPASDPAASGALFAPENFAELTEAQKTQLLVEFSKNNNALKGEITTLEGHRQTLEQEKTAQFAEQKKALVDMVKSAGGQVESLETGLEYLSPAGASLDEQNMRRGTLVAVRNSVETFAVENNNLRAEIAQLKAVSMAGKMDDEGRDRFHMMLAAAKNSAPPPARFEQTVENQQQQPPPPGSQESESEREQKKRKVDDIADQGILMFNTMRRTLGQGTGHINPWG